MLSAHPFDLDLGAASDLHGLDLPRGTRVLCAGCGTGEEAYAVAMVLQAGLGPLGDFAVAAVDNDPTALALAERAVYDRFAVRELPVAHRDRYLERHAAGSWRVRAEIRNRVVFSAGDLLELPSGSTFDLVVLRRVLGAYEPAARRRLLTVIACRLRPGGHLILGAGESLHDEHAPFCLVRPAVYRRHTTTTNGTQVPGARPCL